MHPYQFSYYDPLVQSQVSIEDVEWQMLAFELDGVLIWLHAN